MKKQAISVLLCVFLLMGAIPLVFACEPGTGKVTGGGQCITKDSNTIPSASFGFNAMASSPTEVKGELNYVDHTTGDHFHMHVVEALAVTVDEPGNKPWPMKVADFRGPCTLNGEEGYYAYVHVEDLGEPGTKDTFFIDVWDVRASPTKIYEGGSLTEAILAGNIQIHKPPP